MKNLTWQNPEQLFVAQELINKVKSKCCGIKVYKRFWQVFFIFVPIGFLFLSKPFAIQEFLYNMFCLKFGYNHEWWFLGTYIELLLVLSVMLMANQKRCFPYLIVGLSVLLRGLSGLINLNSGGQVRTFITSATIFRRSF